MRYAITGHTSGIGKFIYEQLNLNIVGFSKSSGYDITQFSDRKRIINEVKDCDIFINNAHDGFAQTYLLIELFKEWHNKNKTIINVGSRITEIGTLEENNFHLLNYQAEKLALKVASQTLNSSYCKVKYKWFGYVGTEKIIKKYPHFSSSDYITIPQAASIILER
jgi:hypothetical protein